MQWLTRDLHGFGDSPLSKAEVTEREAAYARHREAVLPLLPEAFKVLAGEPIGDRRHLLHDGRVESWSLDLPRHLVLSVVTPAAYGDYERLRIDYQGVELVGAAGPELEGWLDDPQTQLLYHEVDALLDGRFEHRHLLWPRGEFGVRFSAVRVAIGSAAPEEYEIRF